MTNETHLTVRGFVGNKPTIIVTPGGHRMTKFRVATTPRVRDAEGGWRDGRTDWYTVKVWREWADNVARSLEKGTPVIVRGAFTVETWTGEDGRERATPTITADSVGVELNTGVAHFTKVVRSTRPDEPGEPGTDGAGPRPLGANHWDVGHGRPGPLEELPPDDDEPAGGLPEYEDPAADDEDAPVAAGAVGTP